jgi:hypothetical protein
MLEGKTRIPPVDIEALPSLQWHDRRKVRRVRHRAVLHLHFRHSSSPPLRSDAARGSHR